MARIANVNIPSNVHIRMGLQYILRHRAYSRR